MPEKRVRADSTVEQAGHIPEILQLWAQVAEPRPFEPVIHHHLHETGRKFVAGNGVSTFLLQRLARGTLLVTATLDVAID